jgi:hypothetical protein
MFAKQRVDSEPKGADDVIDEASEESFPASDPPAWDPLHAGTPAPAEGRPRREQAGLPGNESPAP